MSGQKFYNPVEYGHEIDSRIVPDYSNQDPRQIYAMMEDYYLQGGFRVCDTISGSTSFPSINDIDVPIPNYRNYITFDKRKIGMVAYTLDDKKFWQLINNPSATPDYDREDRTLTTNSDWEELVVSGTLSSLSDVDIAGIQDKYILVYSASTQTWYVTTRLPANRLPIPMHALLLLHSNVLA